MDDNYRRGFVKCIEHRVDGLSLTVNNETLNLPVSMTNTVRLLKEGDEIIYIRKKDNQVESIFVKAYQKPSTE